MKYMLLIFDTRKGSAGSSFDRSPTLRRTRRLGRSQASLRAACINATVS